MFLYLYNLRVRCCGTIRTNRKGLSPEVAVKNREKSTLNKNPGFARWASNASLCFLVDKRPVLMLSNAYLPHDPASTITHWYTARRGEIGYPGKIQKVVNLPPIIKWYRKFMGAVDIFDQYRAYLKIEFRTRKFCHRISYGECLGAV